MSNSPAGEAGDMADPGRKPRITPDDVLEVFNTRDDPAEPLTAPEVAEHLDCSRRTALNKLDTLQEAGDVTSKKVGGRSKVWWLPLEGTDEASIPSVNDRSEE